MHFNAYHCTEKEGWNSDFLWNIYEYLQIYKIDYLLFYFKCYYKNHFHTKMAFVRGVWASTEDGMETHIPPIFDTQVILHFTPIFYCSISSRPLQSKKSGQKVRCNVKDFPRKCPPSETLRGGYVWRVTNTSRVRRNYRRGRGGDEERQPAGLRNLRARKNGRYNRSDGASAPRNTIKNHRAPTQVGAA